MEVSQTPLEGLKVLKPKIFGDKRGCFLETYQKARYRELGIDCEFIQDNVSRSSKGVLRGLHYQGGADAQAKLISVLSGSVFDVAVDLRVGSPTFGEWYGVELNSEDFWQLYVPIGFAHGFFTCSETAVLSYKCSGYYAPESEHSLVWNDSDVKIAWPEGEKFLSPKDEAGLCLSDLPKNSLLPYPS